MTEDADRRAARHAALGDPGRLAIVDQLRCSDRAPVELAAALEMPSNLLAHHLDVLERVGLIERFRSSGDGRRRYVHLRTRALAELSGPDTEGVPPAMGPTLFVCTANSARSQLAAALWRTAIATPASSGGTHPAERVHPLAVAAGHRAGIDLDGAVPTALDPAALAGADLVVTVCDRAHEELDPAVEHLHWSVPDPVADGRRAAFDATVAELRARIEALATAAGWAA